MQVNTTYSRALNHTPALPLSDSVTHIFHVHQKLGCSLNCYGVSAWHLAGSTWPIHILVAAKCYARAKCQTAILLLWQINEELHYGGLRLVWISYLWLDLNAGATAFRRPQLGHL